VFGMGTGDPSQYGHRQIEAISKRLTLRAEILSPLSGRRTCGSPCVLKALGGWLPAACRGVYAHPKFCLRSLKERGRNLAPKTLHFKASIASDLQNFCNEIDWSYKACLEEHPRIAARS
jgi:hypothetical protein